MPELSERRGIWRRFLIGAGLIVLVTAASTAVAALHEINQISAALNESPRLQLGTSLAPVPSGGPENVLVIGSDKRAKTAGVDSLSPAHSDTLMLVRIDPKAKATTMLSIPRDLKVTIYPRHGLPTTQKINAAYAIGGPRLAVETVHRVTGVRVSHVVDVNFRGFREVVNALGCVYVDVDRRYYNDNAGAGVGQAYATINIQPGYQRLCGQDALDYVRYRHTDSDIVRAARQQDFLRQAKQQVSASDLLGMRSKLEQIMGRYVQTDIRGSKAVLDQLTLLAYSVGHPVERIPFPAHAGPSFVHASASEIQQAVSEFMHPNGGGGGGSSSAAAAPQGHGRHHRHHSAGPSGFIPATADDLAMVRSAAPQAGLPMMFDRRQVQFFAPEPDTVRDYALRGTDGRAYRAYRIVIPTDFVGNYYGIEGTTWTSPPLLSGPNTQKRVGGRTLQLYYDGQHLRYVAWHAAGAAYWVSNTVTDQLSNAQMLAVAASAQRVG